MADSLSTPRVLPVGLVMLMPRANPTPLPNPNLGNWFTVYICPTKPRSSNHNGTIKNDYSVAGLDSKDDLNDIFLGYF